MKGYFQRKTINEGKNDNFCAVFQKNDTDTGCVWFHSFFCCNESVM